MINAVGIPQKILLLGGTSEIGLALCEIYLRKAPAEIVLAARPESSLLTSAINRLKQAGATKVTSIAFNATDFNTHSATIDAAWNEQDVDVAIVAFGVMGDQKTIWQDQLAAINEAQINYTAAVSVGVLLANKFKQQQYGKIIALSSVAGEKIRLSNFVYGSTKAGMDGFYIGLSEALRTYNIDVLVARPGQVKTKLSAHVPDAPLTLTPIKTAQLIYNAANKQKQIVWTPGVFRYIMLILRHLPRVIFRKLPF